MQTKQKVFSNRKHLHNVTQVQDHLRNVSKLRSRIHKILDEQFSWIMAKMQKESQLKSLMKNSSFMSSSIVLNESRMEEWVEMFKNEILQIRVENKYETKQIIPDKNNQDQIPQLNFHKPQLSQSDYNKNTLYHINNNKLNFFKQDNLNHRWQESSYQFGYGMIKKYSSLTYIQQPSQLIIIGGSKPTNPNIKSSKILSLNLQISQLKTISNLPYGISSHSSIYHKQLHCIYIIGGNKNYSIISRGCFRLDLQKMSVQQISCLNYPVASASCILWKERWIYKFGGVGEAFGEWNTSPYIQRYDITNNEWEVINPSLREGLQISSGMFQNMFLANSISYLCQDRQKIFVYGGYTISGELKNYGFILKIQEGDQKQQEIQHTHLIQQFGKIDCPNINRSLLMNEVTFVQNEFKEITMYSLVTRNDGSTQPQPFKLYKFS